VQKDKDKEMQNRTDIPTKRPEKMNRRADMCMFEILSERTKNLSLNNSVIGRENPRQM